MLTITQPTQMKPLLLGLLFIASATMVSQAQNIVPNPSFEEYSLCPDGISQIEKATHWQSFRITPNYHNACDLSQVVGVPFSLAGGYQEAKQGEAYAGYHQYTSNGNTEVFGVQLISPLEIGQQYYISYYVNRSKHYGGSTVAGNCWSNGQGVKFTMNPYSIDSSENEIPIDNSSHLFNADLISDTVNWVHLSGTFIADSAYSYMAIGNFYSLANLQYECDAEYQIFTAYYFVDCVCVTTDEIDCELLLSSTEYVQDKLQVYPNPFYSELNIEVLGNEIVQNIDLIGLTR